MRGESWVGGVGERGYLYTMGSFGSTGDMAVMILDFRRNVKSIRKTVGCRNGCGRLGLRRLEVGEVEGGGS